MRCPKASDTGMPSCQAPADRPGRSEENGPASCRRGVFPEVSAYGYPRKSDSTFCGDFCLQTSLSGTVSQGRETDKKSPRSQKGPDPCPFSAASRQPSRLCGNSSLLHKRYISAVRTPGQEGHGACTVQRPCTTPLYNNKNDYQ